MFIEMDCLLIPLHLQMSNQNFSPISYNSHVVDMHRNVARKERYKCEVAYIRHTIHAH